MKRAKGAQQLAALVLCAAMVAGMLPATAFAETQAPPLQTVEEQQEATGDSLPAPGSPAEADTEEVPGSPETADTEEPSVPGGGSDSGGSGDKVDAGETQDTEPAEGDGAENPPQSTPSEDEVPNAEQNTGAALNETAAEGPSNLLGAGEDTFTHSLNGDSNYGSDTKNELRIRNNNKQYAHIYEKFDLAGAVSSDGYLIKAIQHQITCKAPVTNTTNVKIDYLPDNTWDENTITYNNFTKNKPSTTNITSVQIPAGTAKDTAITANLTSGLAAVWADKDWSDSKLSLDLFKDYSADEATDIFVYSRENGSNGPALNIVYETAYTAEQTLLEEEKGKAVTLTLPVSDTNKNSVTLEKVHIPAGATFDPGTGEFSWTPAQTGKEAVVVLVKDSGGQSLGYYVRFLNIKDSQSVVVPGESSDFHAEADTFTHSLNGGNNYGSSNPLRIRNNNKYYAHIYERYDLSGLQGSTQGLIQSIEYGITLQAAVTNTSSIDVGILADNEWDEVAVTYSNFTANQKFEKWISIPVPAGSADQTRITADVTQLLWTKDWTDSKLTLDLFKPYGGDENLYIYSKESGVAQSVLTVGYNLDYEAEHTTIEAQYNQQVQFTLPLADKNSSPVTLEIVSAPLGASLDNGTFTWTASESGTLPVLIRVKQGNGVLGYYLRFLEIEETRPQFHVTMDGKELDKNQVKIKTGEPLELKVVAQTPSGSPLSVSVASGTGLPAGATYDQNTGTFSWTPSNAQVGEHTVVWSSENSGTAERYTLQITVIDKYQETSYIYAEADVYVNSNSGSTTKNYGKDTALALRGGYKWAYLRFPLEGLRSVNGFITDISLRLTTKEAPTDVDNKPAAVTTTPILLTTDAWNEGNLNGKAVETGSNAVTYANMPSYYNESTYLNSFQFSKAEETLCSELTDAVLSEYMGDGKISFCLRNIVSKTNTTFYSREIGEIEKTPALVVTTDCNYEAPQNCTIKQGETLTLQLPKQKGDGTALTLGMDSMPANASYASGTGTFTWTPDSMQRGGYEIFYHASYTDKSGKTICGYFTFTVTVEPDGSTWGMGGMQESYALTEGETLTLAPYVEPVYIHDAAEAVSKNYVEITLAPSASAKDLQQAIDNASAAGGGIITLEAGTYVLNACIDLKSNVTLQGSGKGITVLQKAPDTVIPDTGFLYSQGGVQDVIIRDLTIDVNTANNTADNSNYGILIVDKNGSNYRILVDSIEMRNGGMGFQTKGTYDVVMRNSDFHDNGWGPELYFHNVYIRRTYRALFENCVFTNAAGGNGMNITDCTDIKVVRCDAHDNFFRGYKAAKTQRIGFYGCRAERNGTVKEGDGFTMAAENGGVSDFAIVNCVASGNGRNGLYLVYGSGGYVLNNTGEDNKSAEGFYSEKRGNNVVLDEKVSAQWTGTDLPDGLNLDPKTGALTWETDFQDAGDYRFTVSTAMQGDVLGQKESRKDVVVSVKNMTIPAFESMETQSARVNQKYTCTVQAKDPERGTLVLTAQDMPYGMRAVQGNDNTLTLTWTPQEYQTGTWKITVTAAAQDGSRKNQITFAVYVTNPEETQYDRQKAEALLGQIQVGFRNGEYSLYAVSLLKTVLLNEAATEDEINAAVQRLLSMVNTDQTGDADGDGLHSITDLQIIAEHYQEQDSQYDTDGNGKIEVEDMVFAAKNVSGDAAGLRQLTLEADGGSYISRDNPGTAYHVEKSMNAKDGAFVTFDLTDDALSGEIVEAILELHSVDPAQTGEIALGVMERDTGVCNWDGSYQSLHTATSNSIATVKAENGVLSVNVTAAVQSERSKDGRITFKLQSLNGGDMEFVSDNSPNRAAAPALRIRTKMSVEDCGSVDAIAKDLEQIGLTGACRISENLVLSTVGSHGTKFTWQSMDTDYLADNGTITRPAYETMDVPVELLVTAENGNVKKTYRYVVTIAKEDAPSPAQVSPALEQVQIDTEVTALVDKYWKGSTFTYVDYPAQKLDNVVNVSDKTGEAIQAAIDQVSQAGGGVVQLEAGVYTVDRPIQMRSNVTLAGQGRIRTILMQAETWQDSKNVMLIRMDCVGDITQITDVVLKDFSLYGQKTSSVHVSGIFGGGGEPHHDRIMLQNVSIKHFAGIGFEVKRADNIIMDHSTFMDNGVGNSLYHNVYFLYNKNILQSNLDMSRPAAGKSCKYTSTTNVIAQHIVMRDGKTNAVQADNTGADHILFHDYTIDNFDGYGLWFPCEDYMDKFTYKEDPIFAPQHVILNRVRITNTKTGGIWRIVQDSYILNSYFNNRRDNLQLLKCDVKIENTVFEGPDNGPTYYTSKDQLPDPIL